MLNRVLNHSLCFVMCSLQGRVDLYIAFIISCFPRTLVTTLANANHLVKNLAENRRAGRSITEGTGYLRKPKGHL